MLFRSEFSNIAYRSKLVSGDALTGSCERVVTHCADCLWDLLLGHCEDYFSASRHNLPAELRQAYRRILAAAYRYAACFNESPDVSGDVVLRHLFQQAISREPVEMMIDHLLGA